MKFLLFLLLSITIVASAFAEPPIQRVPVNADMRNFVLNAEQACNLCEAFLTPRGQPNTAALAYVRSKVMDANKSEIQTVYYSVTPELKPKIDGYNLSSFSTDKLNDTTNSFVNTYPAIQNLVSKDVLSADATIIVAPNGAVDTSLIVRAAGPSNFVAEQVSEPGRFAENLRRLRERSYSQDLSVYDFAPRSKTALQRMNLPGSSLTWRFFSWDVDRAFARHNRRDVFGRRTKEALLKRLEDSSGGVVILYAHSDGNDIVLDTDDGIRRLTPNDIELAGKKTGGRLPAIILLNCQTRPVLGPAFLAAGSPFVASTDASLTLPETARFISNLADSVFAGKQDVIDAYFSAQQKVNPTRLHPIVENWEGVSAGPS
jgi:hypothetical protein